MVAHGLVLPPDPGNEPLVEYRCRSCGYGARRRAAPECCPMCSSTAWDSVTGEHPGGLVESSLRGLR